MTVKYYKCPKCGGRARAVPMCCGAPMRMIRDSHAQWWQCMHCGRREATEGAFA